MLGQSIAGVVVDVGENVTRFRRGQRVIAYEGTGRSTFAKPN